MNNINDCKVGERIILNSNGKKAIITGSNVHSGVLYVRWEGSEEPGVILNVNHIRKAE